MPYEGINVVIPTLERASLKTTLASIHKVIKDADIILVLGKGFIGDLRNQGLKCAERTYVCFIDDDIIINKDWFDKCFSYLKSHEDLVCVFGRAEDGDTMGCSICRTQLLQRISFPHLDVSLFLNKNLRYMILEDAVCQHLHNPILHFFQWCCHGFYTESKYGFNVYPPTNLKNVFKYVKLKMPLWALAWLLWFLKSLFVSILSIQSLVRRFAKQLGGQS